MRNITDKCPHDEFCGGCIHQDLDYDRQLEVKEGEVRSLFSQEGITPGIFDKISGCPYEFRYEYRNKMEFTFGDTVKDGPLCLGMHLRGKFMSIVTVDNCQLVEDDFNKILSYTLEFCIKNGYEKYHKKTHKGLLRNLIIRQGKRTRQLLVNIVTSTESDFDGRGWAEGLKELKLDNNIVGIMQTLNDNKADAVLCDKLIVIDGRDYYCEEIMGLKFRVHEFAFFQTNVEAVERLYRDAVNLIDDLNGKEVFDLYCGTGTISQVMALKAKHVLGVEIVPESVASAVENAELNNLSNCDFLCGDVFKVLEETELKPDVIVVDPPRIGMSADAVNKIASYGVNQIVYISCNPKTLVKNLSQFESLGYKVEYVKPYDNFPLTRHVETIALIQRVKS
ncbi:MAG: 23S rRNA (uracil(1939)-C(5))-methyltransferase RlmD [Hornefia sp.]|nr:23S rRNA (uracil(1939)-C(5))-methyltransferase RlmD [Hornefia sp.]